MFLGTYFPRLDDKGRLFLPAKFRAALTEGCVLTRGQERCLYVFTMERFAELAARFSQASMTSGEARDYQRIFFSSASDEVPDKQGRITVAAPLRVHADLTHECVVVGNNDRLEIWNSATWATYLDSKVDGYSTVDKEVIPGI